MFIVKLHKSVIVTYLGVMFGICATYFAFVKMAFSQVSYLRYSLVFLVLAGICDMFDGKIARMCKRTEDEKNFGIQIDSLADVVSFVFLPVVIMCSLGMTSVLDILVYCLFVICGISRLAYFNMIADSDVPVKYYSGLPVTSTAIIYPILGLFHGVVSEGVFFKIYICATALTAILFVLKIRVPKLKGIAYVIVPILSLILISLLLVLN